MPYTDRQDDPRAQVLNVMRDLVFCFDEFRSVAATFIGLGETDTSALSMLNAAGGQIGHTELAARLGLTTSAITSLIDRLEARGFVERVPHPEDRRRTDVAMTTAGGDALQAVREWFRTASAGLPDDQLDIAAEVLRTLGAGLTEQSARLAEQPPLGSSPS